MSSTSIEEKPFGRTPDGHPASLFTLSNGGLRVAITDYGARLVSIETPDRDGRLGHVLLGFDDVAAYATAGGSFGAILGRYANRIAGGKFTLDGQAYQLAVNDSGNTLHGGPAGLASTFWTGAIDSDALVLKHVSPDGDQGFPGTLTTRATYRLLGDRLQIDLTATADRPTIINLSSHPYFNFSDVAANDILGHEISIHARKFLPTDERQIPTGALADIAGTAFDFRTPKPLGAKIRSDDPQLRIARGYDHCFALGGGEGPAATVHDPLSGRRLALFTSQPGLQLYSGNSLDGSIIGRAGIAFRQSAGFALEAQDFPDAPNHASFPSAVLRPGETYQRMIAYRFHVE